MIKVYFDVYLEKGQYDLWFLMYLVWIVNDLYNVLLVDGIVCFDNGMYKIWFVCYWCVYELNLLLFDNVFVLMGVGLLLVIVIKIVYLQCKVIVVCGDGGFMMNFQEFEMVVWLKFDIVVMILCDDVFGMICWKQENMNFFDFVMMLQNFDFVLYV